MKPELGDGVAAVVCVAVVVDEELTLPSVSTGTHVSVVESHVSPELAQQPKVAVCAEQSPP